MRALVAVAAFIGLAACQPAEEVKAEVLKPDAGFELQAEARREAAKPLDPDTVIKVALYRDGHIEVDGVLTEPEQVPEKMKAAAASKKSVVYYRESAETGLSSQQRGAMPAILGAVAANLLPIRFSYEPDFSDTLRDTGTP